HQPVYAKVEGHKALVRSDRPEVVLDIASQTYEVIPNETVFEIAEAVLEAGKSEGFPVKYETAGVLDSGRRVWLLVNLRETMLPGDPSPHASYLYVATSHDGTAALRAGATDVRIVCANTERAADMDAKQKGTVYTFRHTKNVEHHISEARTALMGAAKQLDLVHEQAVQLLSQKVTSAQRTEFIHQFAVERTVTNVTNLTGKDLEEHMSRPSIITRVNSCKRSLDELLDSETCTGISGTAYGLRAAAIEFLDHVRPVQHAGKRKGKENTFRRTVLDGEPQKRLANTVLRKVLTTV
ncbi:DUF932 domain-containing protein, partial [Salinispora arenicola]|uniref:DUF932 domain-containing protein n=1 Tax=Salinispora arenicola TaxID=168697 RepID=UPI000575F0F2